MQREHNSFIEYYDKSMFNARNTVLNNKTDICNSLQRPQLTEDKIEPLGMTQLAYFSGYPMESSHFITQGSWLYAFYPPGFHTN